MAITILKPEKIRPIRGVLFDMDGLVLDTERLYGRFWREAAQKLGHPMTFEQSLGLRSLNRAYGQRYLETCLGKDVDYDTLRNLRIKLMDAWICEHGVEPKPGIGELLDCLHTHGVLCAITTSAPVERARAYLRPLGLLEQFDEVCSGHDLAHGKPAPDIYLEGASRLQLHPRECLALEDSPAGIESAFGAGCLPVVIPDQDQPGEDTLRRCFAKADSLSDVVSLLQRMNGFS